ncbi:MAG: hemerythrin family protein [Aquificae bacterium]|nr:hemerythrin family protein [Aquificota bacterium]
MVKHGISVVQWGPELELGIPEIDEQHRRLVEMLNEFYRELEEGHKHEAARRFFEELEQYVNEHFTYEEAFMRKIGFPELERHRKTHELFKKLVKEELKRYESGDEKALREAVALALSWLYTHITRTDRKYAEYLKEKGLL